MEVEVMRKTDANEMRMHCIVACLVVLSAIAPGQVSAQAPVAALANTPNPELVGMLTKELNVTPQQATGGAGALFGMAKSRLKPDEFSQVAAAVPGMDGLLKAAPKPGGGSALGTMSSALPGSAGGLASVAESFKSLGLSPDMASKFVPVLTQYVQSKGGANVASLLLGALK
jgi:uncharacterized protein VcgC/VcgE DUF2780